MNAAAPAVSESADAPELGAFVVAAGVEVGVLTADVLLLVEADGAFVVADGVLLLAEVDGAFVVAEGVVALLEVDGAFVVADGVVVVALLRVDGAGVASMESPSPYTTAMAAARTTRMVASFIVALVVWCG